MPQVTGERESVVIHTNQARDVTGRLFYPKSDWSGMVALKFATAAAAKVEAGRRSIRTRSPTITDFWPATFPARHGFVTRPARPKSP